MRIKQAGIMTTNRIILDLAALLTSIALLLLGNGLIGTLLGIRAGIEDFASTSFGVIMSSYFIGYIAGAFTIPKLVERVGHIRIFAIMASTASIAAVLHGYFLHPFAWFIFRMLTGFALAGLYMVTESWLNDRASPQNRGKVFSIYMVINLGAVALGQQFLNIDDPAATGLFIIASVLFSLAVIPIGLTKTPAPTPIPSERMKVRKLFKISPLGVVGSFSTGLSNGAFWGISGAYAYQIGLSTPQIATFISLIVLGGMALQTPIGWASDKIDRHYFIVGVSASITVLSLIMASLGTDNISLLYIFSFVYGGVLLTANALCNAHVNDLIEKKDIIQVSGTLLLIFGTGAALGPTLVSICMDIFGTHAFFIYIALIQAIVVSFAIYRQITADPHETTARFVPLSPATSRLASLAPNVVRQTIRRARERREGERRKRNIGHEPDRRHNPDRRL